jgi:hypothetical protein
VAEHFTCSTAEKQLLSNVNGKERFNIGKCSALGWKAEQFLKREDIRVQNTIARNRGFLSLPGNCFATTAHSTRDGTASTGSASLQKRL